VREVITIADLEIELLKRRVRRGNVRIDLTAQEFALLRLSAERQGKVLTRTFITSQLWNMNFDSDTNVANVALTRLWSKVDTPFERKLLQTVRGMGYVLEERTWPRIVDSTCYPRAWPSHSWWSRPLWLLSSGTSSLECRFPVTT